MPQQILASSESPVPQTPAVDCRVFERKPCAVATTCQPASVLEMQELQWAATICDISLSGARITLQRRFEKGTGLAIELRRNQQQDKYVVFVKVIHVRSLGNGAWALGCKFISELNEDELQNILTTPPQAPASSSGEVPDQAASAQDAAVATMVMDQANSDPLLPIE